MENKKLIERFEAELAKVDRPGVDKLLAYIRKSDFYTAPASTRFHLSCPNGLLQHSLNVLDALRGLLSWNEGTQKWEYRVAGHVVDSTPDESVIIMGNERDFMIQWNLKFPLDRWYRKKYGIPFMSPCRSPLFPTIVTRVSPRT